MYMIIDGLTLQDHIQHLQSPAPVQSPHYLPDRINIHLLPLAFTTFPMLPEKIVIPCLRLT